MLPVVQVIFSIAAHRAGVKQVTGIDISENMVEIGKKKVGDLHLADAIELKTGDCEHMEFATRDVRCGDGGFSVCVNFEHLELGLQEMYRVLKTGGKVIILEFSMPEHFPMKQLYRFLFLSYSSDDRGDGFQGIKEPILICPNR